RGLTTELLRETIQKADIELKEVVLQNLDEIYERFVTNISRPFA
ncbi:MAG: D-alanyl-D-alanine carboxypeptidase family protein, partial [Gemmatimonadales bacterium]|nr:D-alanyl-D-alanine carboxypeptidase family protein [Gemmatimonadales bacterium]